MRPIIRPILNNLVMLSIVLFGTVICNRGPSPNSPHEPSKASSSRPKEVRAVFTTPDGRRSEFTLEVADTPATRATGLMFRRELAPERGMVFVFPSEDYHTFYMKNTYIPLDMIFISSDLKVVGVIENARPLTLDIRSVDRPSLFVVEVRAFSASSKGIGPGTLVRFDPPLGPAAW